MTYHTQEASIFYFIQYYSQFIRTRIRDSTPRHVSQIKRRDGGLPARIWNDLYNQRLGVWCGIAGKGYFGWALHVPHWHTFLHPGAEFKLMISSLGQAVKPVIAFQM